MMRNIRWNIIFYVCLGILALAGIIVLMNLVAIKDDNQICTSLRVSVEGKETFIDQDDISRMINNQFGAVVNKKLKEIKLQQIEEAIEKLPYVSRAELFVDMDGILQVHVQQREVILRVISKDGRDYYVDRQGHKVPVTLKYVPKVLVANGNIQEGYRKALEPISSSTVKDLVKVVDRVADDPLWGNQIVQMYVNDQKDIELIPRVGSEVLLIGSADSLNDKLHRLEIYYKNILPKVGVDAYEKVNVKYGEQIICERKNGWFMDSLQMKINTRN